MAKSFRFEDLEEKLQIKLRRIYHSTTIKTAVRIAKSRHIWSKAPLGYANFSHGRNPYYARPDRDVSLTFNFLGEVNLVSHDFPAEFYEPHVLYIHLLAWPEDGQKGWMHVSAVRLPAGSTDVLKCVGYRLSDEFDLERRISLRAAMLADELEAAFVQPLPIYVPEADTDRFALSTSHPPLDIKAPKVAALAFSKFRRSLTQSSSPQ